MENRLNSPSQYSSTHVSAALNVLAKTETSTLGILLHASGIMRDGQIRLLARSVVFSSTSQSLGANSFLDYRGGQ